MDPYIAIILRLSYDFHDCDLKHGCYNDDDA